MTGQANIGELILNVARDGPSLTNGQVAEEVRRRVPGARTSAATVASVRSRARRRDGAPAVSDGRRETADECSARIADRFVTLERMVRRVADGALPSLIVSGPPGLGKSFTVERVLEEAINDPLALEDERLTYDVISGTITAPGLMQALWEARDGGVLVLDDCDDVLRDEVSLNMLKAVLDGGGRRVVSYRRRAPWMDELGIPRSFKFDGSVVFCTNLDFDGLIGRGSALAPHLRALIDRSLYLSLSMHTRDDLLARIRQVALDDGLLASLGLSDGQAHEVLGFVEDNAGLFHGLSLRLVEHVAHCYVSSPATWREDVAATKMRGSAVDLDGTRVYDDAPDS